MITNLLIILLIGVNVLVSYKGFNDRSFFSKYMFHIGRIQQGEKIRMISSAFLHADVTQLIFNMLTLYIFAPIIIDYFNSITFLIIYFLSLLAGNFFTLNQHKNEPNYSAIGASGAVTGIVYGSIVIYPQMSLYFFFIPIYTYSDTSLPFCHRIYAIFYIRNEKTTGHDWTLSTYRRSCWRVNRYNVI